VTTLHLAESPNESAELLLPYPPSSRLIMKPPRNYPMGGQEPGPSHGGDEIGPEQMREIQEAVQAIPPMDDPSFRDPLGDYCDGSSFNIVQFLADDKEEDDSPSVSPAGAGGQLNPQQQLYHHQQPQHHHMVGMNDPMMRHQQQLQQQQNNNRSHAQLAVDSHLSTGGRSQLPSSSRLPDSPPITDVSAGSSGSPSSSSNSAGSPYSPADNYASYNTLNGNNGLILGVNDLSVGAQDVGMLDALLMPQAGIPANGRHPQQMQQAYLHSPYQTQPNQLSPPEMAAMNANQAQYAQQMANYGGNLDMYEIPMGVEQANLGRVSAAPSRKRARNDNNALQQQQQQQEMKSGINYDPSRVKPDPTLHYPQPAASRFVPPATPGLMMASSPIGGESFIDENFAVGGNINGQPVIRFTPFNEPSWQRLYADNRSALNFSMHVVADKGFNYSTKDGCFVNQKKNHFQVSVNIEACDDYKPQFVAVDNVLKPIQKMQLAFCGVKSEMHSTFIEIKQSQNDRKPGVHKPVELAEIPPRQVTKVTVPRLHFSETTLNNQRKNNKPNPDQKYFLLLVRLIAVTTDGLEHLVLAYASDRVIVRATNPGQFEPPEQDIGWMNADGMMYIHHPVAIGSNQNYGGLLNVAGDIALTGTIQQPSDRRLKENIVNLDKKEAMERLNKLRIVEYNYKEEVARAMGMSEQAQQRYGIIAQELAEIHPKSVNKDGEFLTVDENRIFYDNIAAVQELSKMHEDLEVKIDGRVENMQAFFGKIFRRKDAPKTADGISVVSEDSGLAGQKALSTSRYSLASTFKREIAKQSKQETCRNPSCSRSENSHCSSKLTQGTIVSLVIVMAVCLLSMSALYVLDWHHRNYGFHARIEPIKPDDEIGFMIKTITMPRHQPGAPPLHDMCLHGGCRSYCCENKVSYATETRMGGFDPLTVKPLAGSKKAFLAAIAGAQKITPTAFFPKPFPSGTRFEIEGMNMTIDSRYCTERSCNEKKGRYYLFVPVSPYMPTTPVMLRITPPSGKFVQSCGHMLDFQDEECPVEGGSKHFSLNMPTALEVESNLFEVSAGSYKRSGYRFRVGTNTESCFGSEERFKSSFEEYNIVFYRTCGDDSDQAPMTIVIENERDFGIFPKHSHSSRVLSDSRPNATVA
ncbi:hypothetical protein PMAYCL1PPCAC_31247, partial [Pristionchus mayeri]